MFTVAQLEEILPNAIQAADWPAVEMCLARIAVADPERAQTLIDLMRLGIDLRERQGWNAETPT